jgi:DNA replication protein DnaC
MTAIAETSPLAALVILLRALKLPTIARHAEEVAQIAEREGWGFVRYLHHLVELEVHERRRRRIERNLRQSELPPDKTLAMLTRSRLPAKVAKQLPTLCEGAFLARGDNLLAFGLPGRGKTHLICAIGHELIQRGHRVLFVATYALVQRLLAAKRDLRLEEELAILDGYDAIALDDIGYVQQSRDEMEVLFTFLAERYERRSVMITSNLVFSEWDKIFKDPMTTAAAIDRLVHHSVILEMTGPSIRIEAAQADQGGSKPSDSAPSMTPTTTLHATPSAASEAADPTTTTPTTTTTATMAPTTTTTPTTPIPRAIGDNATRPNQTLPTSSTKPTTSIPGATPKAPGPATSTTAAQPPTKGDPATTTKKIKNRDQRTETDDEM